MVVAAVRRFKGKFTGRQSPGQDTTGRREAIRGGRALGGVEVHGDARTANAKRLDGSTRVAGSDVLTVGFLVVRLQNELERLGLDILGHGGGGTSEERESGGGLHCDFELWCCESV